MYLDGKNWREDQNSGIFTVMNICKISIYVMTSGMRKVGVNKMREMELSESVGLGCPTAKS